MKGRKRKPTALKILAGNPGKRPLNKCEPQLPPGAGAPPEFLNREARSEWKRISKILTDARVLTEGDRAILTVYCVEWSRMMRAEKALKITGDVLLSDQGGLYQSPHLSVSRRAQEQIAKCAAVLGIDPANRSKVVAGAEPEDDDDMDMVVKKRLPPPKFA